MRLYKPSPKSIRNFFVRKGKIESLDVRHLPNWDMSGLQGPAIPTERLPTTWTAVIAAKPARLMP